MVLTIWSEAFLMVSTILLTALGQWSGTVYSTKSAICNSDMCNKTCNKALTIIITRMLEKINKSFKQEIGIAEKSQETRRDCSGGNVNHKSLFWLSDPQWSVNTQNRDLWFTLPLQQSLGFFQRSHVTFNSRNTLLKKPWGSVGFSKYSDCALSKNHGDVLCFVKTLDFGVEIKKRFDAYNEKTIVHCDWCTTLLRKLILRNLF